jgi:hypothetical protein
MHDFNHILTAVLQVSLLVSVLISFYILIEVIVYKNKADYKLYTNWQFPMLLALLIDSIFQY